MSKVISNQAAKNQLLVKGMTENIAQLKGKGLDEAFISQLKSENDLAAAYNLEYEKLSLELRAKSRALNAKMEDVRKLVREAKRTIKRDFDKSQWTNFGITDLR